MSRIAWIVCALGWCLLVAVPTPAPADEKKPAEVKPTAKKGSATERALDALGQEVTLREGTVLGETTVGELAAALAKRFQVNFVINEEAFRAANGDAFVLGEQRPKLAVVTDFSGATVHQFLTTLLGGFRATYLVRNGAIEFVPVHYAVEATKSRTREDASGYLQLREPLVSAIVKEKPLNEAVAKIAEVYDLTVVVGPQAGDAKTGFVTARLLNVPADKAIELLALQADLRVVRRGAAYLITSKDHAAELFGERLDRERQKIEVDKLREAPAKPPAPPAPPAKQ